MGYLWVIRNPLDPYPKGGFCYSVSLQADLVVDCLRLLDSVYAGIQHSHTTAVQIMGAVMLHRMELPGLVSS